MTMRRRKMKMPRYRIKPSKLRIVAKFLRYYSIICPPVQNEDDDWQENEELRAIEGLEGEPYTGAHRRAHGGPRGAHVVTISTLYMKPTSLCAPLRRCRSAKAGFLWAQGEDRAHP